MDFISPFHTPPRGFKSGGGAKWGAGEGEIRVSLLTRIMCKEIC